MKQFTLLCCLIALIAVQAFGQGNCCNILTNGNFEAGNTGFTSGLPLNCGCIANSYCVKNNFNTKCSGWPSLTDHTTGSGNFLIIDGNPAAPTDVWRNTVNLTQGGTYCFSFWAASVYTEPFNLELQVDGVVLTTFSMGGGASWSQNSSNIPLGSGTHTLVLRQETGGAIQDFGLDDIEFGLPLIPDFISNPDLACGMNVQFFTQVTGPGPLTYFWLFGDPASGGANSTAQQNPTHKFTKCGDFEVCLTVSRGTCMEKICKTITVVDDEAPIAKCNPGVGVTLNANCQYPVTTTFVDNGSTDNCQIKSLSVSPTLLTGCGDHTVTLTVTDLCDNTSTCTMGIQTIEVMPPSITCPPGVSVQGSFDAMGQCTGQVKLPLIGVVDNCDANVAITNNGPGLIFPVGQTTVIYTATDDCSNTATCTWMVTVLPCNNSCPCPNGVQPASNLVKNGDFSNGNMDFTSDFAYFAPGGLANVGAYSVLTQPDVPMANSQWMGAGSTTGSSTDMFLVCDGLPLNGNNVAWRQTIPGTTTGNFVFCFKANNLVKTTSNYTDPRMQGFVNGVAVTPVVTLPETPDQWITIMGNWSGTLPVVLEIRTLSGASVGNDFGIDDIVFGACATMPSFCVANFTFQATNSCGGYSFTNTSTNVGATPTWSWEVDGNPVATTQNLTYQFLTPGVHQVCLTVNGRECRVCKKVTVDIAPPKITCPPDTCIFVPYQPNVGLQVIVNYDPPVVSIPTGCQVTVDCQAPSGSFFGVGTTPVTCTATLLPSGITSSCTFLVMIKEDTLPTFTPLSPICVTDPPLLLNTYATPTGGTFTGTGVTCGGGFCTFDPSAAGVGVHTVTYTYTNSYNHTFTTFANIQVTPATECDTSDCCLRNEVFVQTLSEDPCCFNISVENYCPKEFAGVCLQGLQGVQFASSMANPNWTKYDFGTSKILFDAPGSAVPDNTVSLIGKVCLLNPTNGPQQIEVIFVDQNYQPTDCRRIIETYCPASKDTACLLPIEPKVVCNDDGTYTFTFNVWNKTNPPFTINSIEINADPNFTVVPSYFVIPGGILPNNVSTPFSVNVSGSGAVAGANFCITLTGHNTDIITDPPTMCCTDTAKVCIKLPNCCDCKKHLMAYVIPKGNGATDCCYQLEINNQYKCHPLAFIEANLITPGVTYGTVTPQPGWYYTGGLTTLNFYKFPPGNIPIGISQLPTFCLDNHLPVQYIAVNYHFTVNGQDKILCSDTLTLVCPPEAACDSLLNPKLVCLPNGDFQYSFQVFNNSGQSINTVTLLPTTPGVLPIAPIMIPTLANQGTSALITVTIPGSQLAGQTTFCVKLKVSMILPNGLEIFCCTNPNPVCVPVPPCPCECGKWTVSSFTIGGVAQTGNPCGGTFTVTTGQQVVLNQSFSCIGVNCNTTYLWERYFNGIKYGPFFFSNSANLNVSFTSPGLYCYRITPYCNGKPCEPCYVCFEVKPKQEWECGQWKRLKLLSPGSLVTVLTCGQTVNLLCNQPYSVLGDYGCISTVPGALCYAQYSYTITGPNYNVSTPFSNNLNVPVQFPTAGLYTLTIKPNCGGIDCPPCVIKFKVDCPPVCECGGPQNVGLFIVDRGISVNCNNGNTYPLSDWPVAGMVVSGIFTCVGSNCMPTNTMWTLTRPNASTTSGTFTPNPAFSFTIPSAGFTTGGSYTLTIQGLCGTQTCTCVIKFTLPEPPPQPCDCKNNLVRNPGFWQGAVPGNSMPPGTSNFWQNHSGSPQVTNSDYHCDPTCIQIWGTSTGGEAIRQLNINFIQGRYYKVSFCAKYISNGSQVPNVQVEFNASNVNGNPWSGTNCTLIGTSNPISNQGGPGVGWQVYTLPIWQAPSNLSHLIINAQTTSNLQAFSRIDNVCIEEVAAPCKADFTFTALGGCGKYQFNNLSAPTSGTTYMWDFGDGSPMVTTVSPMHQYATCGTYTVCLTAKCADGSTSTICKQLGIIDNVPPVAKCKPGIGVTLDANCQYLVATSFVNDNSTDNCLIQSLSVSPTVLTGCTNHTVTLTVTDWCNNTSTCTMGIQTTEAVPPVIMCPQNTVVRCNDAASIAPSVTGIATATDNCPGPITITYTDVSTGPMPCDGIISRTWKATDACMNMSVCTQRINVIDNIAPVLTKCPSPNLSVLGTPNPQGLCSANLTIASPMAMDNCDQSVMLTNSFNGTNNASGIYPNGPTTVVWTAVDDCGNKATCSFAVTVQCCPGCPTGTAQGPELVTNGDFSATPLPPPPIGFTSAYGLLTSACQPGLYNIATSLTVANMCPGEWGGIDHTTGSPTGQFFVADGSTSPNIAAWRSLPMNLLTNQSYNLCAFVNNLDVPGFNSALPTVQAYIVENNGVGTAHLLGSVTPAESPDVWVNLSAIWAAPTLVNPCVLEFRSSSLAFGGNNFALDDISFRACPKSCTADFNVQQIDCNGKYQFNGFANGTPTYTYLWDFGDPNSGAANNTSSLQNPMHQFSGPGTYTVTLKITDATGCMATYSVTITIPPFPTTTITANPGLTICEGQNTTLTATGGPWTNCQWSNSVSGPSIVVTTPGTYCVTCTDASGCTATACATVVMIPASLLSGLTGYFPFNGSANADDVSTTDIDGTLFNITPVASLNAPGSAYNFNGSSSYINATNNTRGVSDKVSVVAWVKTTETQRGMWVAGQYVGGNTPKGYLLSVGDVTNGTIGQPSFSGRVDQFAYSGATAPTTQKVNDDQWHCIVGTAGNDTWKIYVNGTLATSAAGPTLGGIASSAKSFTIGTHSDQSISQMWFKGDMDDVRVYNRVLSECEVEAVCAKNFPSGTSDFEKTAGIRIFPNPNPGLFTVELPQPAAPGMAFRVTDLAGRLVLQKQTEAGSQQQTVQAGDLPDGLYFLQVVLDGRVLAVEKFVKQH